MFKKAECQDDSEKKGEPIKKPAASRSKNGELYKLDIMPLLNLREEEYLEIKVRYLLYKLDVILALGLFEEEYLEIKLSFFDSYSCSGC